MKKRKAISHNYSKIILFVCILAVLFVAGSILYLLQNNSIVYKKLALQQNEIDAVYAAEHNDTPVEMAENADFIFTGVVEQYAGTEYTDQETFVDSTNQKRTVYNTFTKYKVKITENIKNTVDNDNVIVEKLGGVRKDYSSVDILENDELLQEGVEYLFLVSYHDGSYKACGENTSIKLSEANEEILDKIKKAW